MRAPRIKSVRKAKGKCTFGLDTFANFCFVYSITKNWQLSTLFHLQAEFPGSIGANDLRCSQHAFPQGTRPNLGIRTGVELWWQCPRRIPLPCSLPWDALGLTTNTIKFCSKRISGKKFCFTKSVKVCSSRQCLGTPALIEHLTVSLYSWSSASNVKKTFIGPRRGS